MITPHKKPYLSQKDTSHQRNSYNFPELHLQMEPRGIKIVPTS